MRLSKFMKEIPSPVERPPAARPQSKAPLPFSPPSSAQQIFALEKEMKERLEKEFQIKLEMIEKELKRNFDQKMSEENKRAQERETLFEKEQQEITRRMEELEQQREALMRQKEQSLQAELAQRVESERRQAELDPEQLKSASRMKEKSFADEVSWRLQAETSKIEEKRQQPQKAGAKAASKLAAIKPREEKPFPSVPPPVISPEPSLPAVPPSLLRPSVPVEPRIGSPDEETLKKVREIYTGLVKTGQKVFDQTVQGKVPELSSLRTGVSILVEFVLKREADMVGAILQDYPDSNYFSYHAANCAVLSVILGLDFKRSKEQLEELALAAFLHDIGLAGIREGLDYPKQLPPDLQNEVLKHPEQGAKILESIAGETIVNAVLQHHETANGKGYPQGLSSEKIHLYARLIHVADSFEAMTHFRPYRERPMAVHEAVKEMVEKGRDIYDREILKTLMGRIGLYPVMSLVELSNQQIGRVIRQNPRFPLSPIVSVEFDEEGNKLKQPIVMDLTQNQLIHITQLLKAIPSYGRARIEREQTRSEKMQETAAVRNFIPFVLAVAILVLLIYIVFKI